MEKLFGELIMKNANLLMLLLFTLLVSCGEGKVNRVLDTTEIVRKSEGNDVTKEDLDNLAEKFQSDLDEMNNADDSDVNVTINRVEVAEEGVAGQAVISEEEELSSGSEVSENSDSGDVSDDVEVDLELLPSDETEDDAIQTIVVGQTDIELGVGQTFLYQLGHCKLIQVGGITRVICTPLSDSGDRDLRIVGQAPCYDLGTLYEHGQEWEGLFVKKVRMEIPGFFTESTYIDSEQIVYQRKKCEDGEIIIIED